MIGFGKKKEKLALAEADRSALEKSFDDPAFIQHLHKYEQHHKLELDVESDTDVSELMEVKQSYELRTKAEKQMKDLFREHFKERSGLELPATATADMEAFFSKESIENAANIETLAEQIAEFLEQQKKIAEQEKVIKKFGSSEQLGEQERLLKLAKGKWWRNAFGKSAEQRQAVTVLERDYKLNMGRVDIDQKLEEISAKKVSVQSAEAMKKQYQDDFADVRKELLQNHPLAESVFKKAEGLVQVELLKQFKPDADLVALENLQTHYDRVRGDEFESETGPDFLKGFDTKLFQKQLDESLKLQAEKAVLEAVQSLPPESVRISGIEKALVPFLQRKRLGSLDQEQAQEFIQKQINDLLTNRTVDPLKKVVIRRFISKHHIKT